jgi:beta-lactamase regulating signal transducer with metallopeptidase domain
MSLFLVDTPFSMLVWLAAKATAILAAAALLQALWRRRTSAATRHLTWTIVVASLLLLPLAWQVAPRWSVAVATLDKTGTPAAAAAPALDAGRSAARVLGSAAAHAPMASEPAPAASPIPGRARVSAWTIALAIYAAGVVAVLFTLGLHHWRVRRLAARASAVREASWTTLLAGASAEIAVRRPVRLLRSRAVSMPMTLGTRLPTIVVPATADLWSDDRRRAVLLHELAHVARLDCLTQTLALIACAAYWPHPAVWWVARQLRVERELACDDRVLAAGAEPRAYAGHLLEIAYSLDGRRAPALAVSMARPSQLEGRLLAALDEARNRRSPGALMRAALGALASAAVVALAGATPIAAPVPEPFDAAAAAGVEATPAVATREADEAVGETAQDDRDLPGTWEIRASKTAGMIYLRLTEGRSNHGRTVPITQLEGLSEAQLAASSGPVTFRITRDAGTLHFEGVARSGVAAGTFTFTPNPAFPAELEKRGFARPTAREQYQLARHDVGYAFVDELNRQGYAKPDTAGLVTAGQHGVDTTYLREMGALGYSLGTLPPLVTLRDHGVTPDYVRGMAEAGYAKLPADTVRQARDHGVGPEYVKAMRDAGYGALPLEAVINARDHGVTPEFVRALADGGYRGLSLDRVIRVRDHGVTPDYIAEMHRLGYKPPIDELVRARDHGITPDYAKELKALGYDDLSLDDLVMLRDHGVTPDRVRSANNRAGKRLPIDMLRSLADGGGLR